MPLRSYHDADCAFLRISTLFTLSYPSTFSYATMSPKQVVVAETPAPVAAPVVPEPTEVKVEGEAVATEAVAAPEVSGKCMPFPVEPIC